MTVAELVDKLNCFSANMEVTITDGYDCKCYEGDFVVAEFEGTVDIGIGGFNVN